MYKNIHVTVVIPALNEEEAIARVVHGLRQLCNLQSEALIDDIIVADNGSKDATAVRALSAGARVVAEPDRGYGSACLAALSEIVNTDTVVFVDGDCSVNPEQTPALLEAIVSGADLAIGARGHGWIDPGAMTFPQWLGNAIVARLVSRIWRTDVSDIGPFRAIRYSALKQLAMRERTFGWTVEMQVKALQQKMKIIEVPVDCRVRVGRSKVSGTVKGVIGAGYGMLATIAKLWWQGRQLNGWSAKEHTRLL